MAGRKKRFPSWLYTQEDALNPVFLWIMVAGVLLIILLLYWSTYFI